MGKKLFNPTVILPPESVISSAGSHLYRIGLSLYPKGPESRPKINNPLLIFTVNSIIALRSCVSLQLKEENRYEFELLSDWTYFMNAREIFGATIISCVLLSNISQLLHYWYYKKDIKPSYLKPFEMMSGLVSPQSISLYNEKDVRKLMIRFKILIKLSVFNAVMCGFSGLFLASIPIISNCSLNRVLFPGIPWFILFSLYGYYNVSFLMTQMTYFYIICYYLKIKLQNINTEIKNEVLNKSKLNNNIVKYFTNSLNSIYLEINEYNANYWSKFLFLFLFLLNTCINSLLYKSIFGNSGAFLQITIRYVVSICIFMLLMLFIIASSVFAEVKNSYGLLNRLFVSHTKLNVLTRYKV
jgi:hypothetical protein